MVCDLDKKIRLNNITKHKSLYTWCLQETDESGEQVGRDLIPWAWSFNFTASELRLVQEFNFGERSSFDTDDSGGEEQPRFQDSETITGNLHPGLCTDGINLEDEPSFSMFGTDRRIAEFRLRITAVGVGVGEKEYCHVNGFVSFTFEIDFQDITHPDTVEIALGLSQERFDKLAGEISRKSVDVVRVRVSKVSGFYSEWSPSISTRNVKVLTRDDDQKVDIPEDCEIKLPKLGEVGEFGLTLVTRSMLNPKQSFATLNISKLFEDDYENYEEEREEPEDVKELLLAQIARNQVELLKLKTPVWLVTLFLGLLALSLLL